MTQRNMASCSNSISLLFLTCLIGFCQAACFSHRCDSPGQFHDCIQGEWTCDQDEYCEVTIHDQNEHGQGVVHLNCRDIESLAECQTRYQRNSPRCDVHTHSADCHWCCRDRECMLLLERGIFPVEETTGAVITNTGNSPTTTTTTTQPAPTVTNTPTAVATESSTTTTTTTQAPTTTTETTTSKTLSPETKPPETTLVSTETTTKPTSAGTTPSPSSSSEATSTDTASATTTGTAETTLGANCQDRYLGDCEKDFGDQCDDRNVRIMCPHTCKACP